MILLILLPIKKLHTEGILLQSRQFGDFGMCPLNKDITKVLYSSKSTNKQAQYDLKGDFLIKIFLFFSSPHLDIFRVGKHLSSIILPSYSRLSFRIQNCSQHDKFFLAGESNYLSRYHLKPNQCNLGSLSTFN